MKSDKPRVLVRINLKTGKVGMHLDLPRRSRCKVLMKKELKESKREIRKLRSELDEI